VSIETAVAALGKSSIKIEHRLMKAGELSVEGFETRVFVAPDATDPERMKAQPIPPEFVARLTHGK
jgi:acyl-CoA thioesterase FadM